MTAPLPDWTTGGLVMLLAGAALAAFRRVPEVIARFAVELWSVRIELRDHFAMEAVSRLLAVRKATCTVLSGRIRYAPSGRSLVIEAGHGRHFIRYQGRWLVLQRVRELNGTESGFKPEIAYISALGRDAAILRRFIEEALVLAGRETRAEWVHIVDSSGEWRALETPPPRPLESVILPAGLAEDLLEAVLSFLASREDFVAKGIPWRLSLGLFGPPGTGKSSFAQALAGAVGGHLYWLDVNALQSDRALVLALSHIPVGSVILLEDADTIQPEERPSRGLEGETGVTLGGLLNAMDGALAGEGRVWIITSNHPERLDPRLLRPGRIDRRVEIGPATEEQARRLYLSFYPGDTAGALAFGRAHAGRVMAEIQQTLLVAASNCAAEEAA